MQDKQIALSKVEEPALIDDVLTVIGRFCDTQTVGRLSQTHKRAYFEAPCLFKVQLSARELLRTVFDADWQGKATERLKRITTEQGGIVLERVYGEKELCDRVWKKAGVSCLEFAAWIGDITLMNALLAKVPRHMKSEALAQLRGVLENGLEHGSHMAPFHVFIQACKNKEDSVERIGGGQKLLALFGLQWLLDQRSFSPLPTFKSAPCRNRTLNEHSLAKLLSVLGSDFFISKSTRWLSSYLECKRLSSERNFSVVMLDNTILKAESAQEYVAAFEALCTASYAALNAAISQLEHELEWPLTKPPSS